MRTKTVAIGTALAALIALGIGAAGSAANAKPHRGHGDFSRLEHKLTQLDLAPATESAVFAIIDDARPTQRALRSQIRDARDDLRTLLREDVIDEATLMEQVDVVGSLKTAARKHNLRTWLQVRAALSPEDRAALSELREHRRPRK